MLLFSHTLKKTSWRSLHSLAIHRRKRINSAFYFKTSNDVELGLKQQYIQIKHFSNNNEHETTNNNINSDEKSSRLSSEHSVCLIRAAKTVVLLLVITVCSIITFYMGWIYGLQAIIVAIIAILIASGKWRYII